MEAFKDIAVHLYSAQSAVSVLQTALLVARKFDGHLDVFHVHPDPSGVLPVPVVSADMAGFVVTDVIRAEEQAFAANATEVKQAFDDFARQHALLLKDAPVDGLKEVSAGFREIASVGDEAIAWCSRVADLTVVGRPNTEVLSSNGLWDVLNTALMESGSAILIAPNEVPESVGRRIVIAWDATQESAKAVTLALPFLARAEEVVILETEQPNEEWADAKALANRLAWHGIKADTLKMPEVSSVSAKGAEIVRQTCGRFDLLVTGAFTQNSMRRWIVGSMTRYLIENADISLLMTH